MTSELLSLYTTLFTIVVSVAGIALTIIFAITQIFQPLLTFKTTRSLLKSKSIKLSLLLIIVALFLTSNAMLTLSIDTHDLFTGMNFHWKELVESNAYLFASFFFSISSLVFLVILFYIETKYLIPSNAVNFIKGKSTIAEVRSFFELKYAEAPMPHFINLVKYISDEEESDDDEEDSEEELKKKYEKDLDDYEKKKKKASKLENPLLPMESYLISSIKRVDIRTVSIVLRAFEDTIIELSKDSKKSNAPHHVVKYYISVLSNSIELASSQGTYSIISELIESSNRLVNGLIEQKQFSAVDSIIEFWQESADSFKNNQPHLFKQIMSSFRELGENILRDKKIKLERDSAQSCIDNICRALGWLGERLLELSPPEKKPIMHNTSYQTEFDSLMNAVLALGWPYQNERPKEYPLIYFDCLYVIAKSVIPHHDEETNDLSDTIFSLMHEHESFAEAAIRNKNAAGASLALLKLKDHVTLPKNAGLEKETQYALESVLRIGAFAASQNFKEAEDFLSFYGKDIPTASIKILGEHGVGYDLSKEAREVTIKIHYHTDYKALKKYLKEAEAVLGSGFGMNLD